MKFVLPILLLACIAASATQPAAKNLDFAAAAPDHFTLHGTLLLPPGATAADPVPAILLLPGSGPTDRDGNQPPYLTTNLLRDIASSLASRGFATFRFDKRACPGYASAWPKSIIDQNAFFSAERFVSDAAAAFDTLNHQPGVDTTRLAILGHSEGGLIALELTKFRRPDALILLSTCGRDLGAVLIDQLAANLQRNHADPAAARAYLDAATHAIDQIRKDSALPENLPPDLGSLFPANCTSLLHTYFTTNPLLLAADYRGPVLLLQGSADIQVSPEKDFKPLLKTFSARPTRSVTDFLLIPNASHNFKLDASGFTGPTALAALDKITDWISFTFKL